MVAFHIQSIWLEKELSIRPRWQKQFSVKVTDSSGLLSCYLPVVQSVQAQLLAHVSNNHTGESQQGLWIPQLQQKG